MIVELLMPTSPPAIPRYPCKLWLRWSAVALPVAKLAAIVPLLRPTRPPAVACVPWSVVEPPEVAILPLAVTLAFE